MTSYMPTPEASASRPVNNAVTASVPADWTPGPEPTAPTPFATAVDDVLRLTAELARNLVGAHQSAATLIVSGDWKHARKWFSHNDPHFFINCPTALQKEVLVLREGRGRSSED
jgi:hypothetical protein